MKMFNKKPAILALLMALLCCALLMGCEGGGEGGVSEIFVQKMDMPRLSYVQGQELDLHGGVLTAVVDGVAGPVPMDAADVTVTGYNKDQLGKQTLTITYMGKTTTIEVEVKARATADGHETNYFVGDSYDNSKGKLKVLKDDGTTATVNLNSEEVTLKSFDSSKAGKTMITVVYGGQECSFEVTVHEVASIQLKTPKKTKYASHETELSLAGGYLTVEAASPSTFSRHVPLTAEMVSGFDPSKMTFENRDQVIKQTITVNYSGKQASYEVEIVYSDVHLVQHLAQKLNHLVWTQETLPELTEEEMADAITAVETYMDMTPLEQSEIDEATLHQILFPAVMGLRARYAKGLEEFADAFGITADGKLVLIGKSYEAFATAATRLEDENDSFNVCAALSERVATAFGDVLLQNVPLKNLLMYHNAETGQQLIDMFRYVMNLHDLLVEIPEEWTVETLQEHEMAVANAVSKIIIGKYQGANYNVLYKIVSSWRTRNDYMDIIYTYYTYIKADGMEELQGGMWQIIPLPGLLNDWFSAFMQALQMEQFIMQYETTQAYLYDTAGFVYYYYQTMELGKQIQECDNELYRNLYRVLEFDKLLDQNLRSGPKGYMYLMNQALDAPEVMEMWDTFLVILDQYAKNVPDKESYTANVKATFAALVDLAPSDLFAFLSSMNCMYAASRGGVLVLDCGERVYNTMMSLVAGYYYSALPENVFLQFRDLLLAMENLALVNLKETAMDEFKAIMQRVDEAYKAMNAEEKAAFDENLGAAYTKYMGIYNRICAGTNVDQGKYEEKMQLLMTTLEYFDSIMSQVMGDTLSPEVKNRTMPVVMALYDKAYGLYNELMAAGADVRLEMITRTYPVEELQLTPDSYYSAVRRLFVTFMLSAGLELDTGESYMLWELYGESAVRPLLAKMADMLLAEATGKLYEGTDVNELMVGFRQLAPEDKKTFFILGVNQTFYAALERYFCHNNEGLREFVSSLWRTEIAFAVDQYTQEPESLQGFKEAFEQTKALYEALENKQDLDAILQQMYALYEQAYKDVTK